CSRGGVRDPLRTESIEEDLVLATQLDVLKTGAVHQRVVRDVEDVVRLPVGQVQLEEFQLFVDPIRQLELQSHAVDEPDSPTSDAPIPLGNLVADVAATEHGARLILQSRSLRRYWILRRPKCILRLRSARFFWFPSLHSK